MVKKFEFKGSFNYYNLIFEEIIEGLTSMKSKIDQVLN